MSRQDQGQGPAVAVVLGAAVWPGGVASPTLARRTDHAIRLWRAGEVQVILGCGGVGRHGPAEAEVIADLCRAAGVPEAALRREAASTSTEENLRFARPLLALLAPSQVVIVTDGFHAPRARLVARRLGLQVVSAPVGAPLTLRRIRAGLREMPAYLWTALRLWR